MSDVIRLRELISEKNRLQMQIEANERLIADLESDIGIAKEDRDDLQMQIDSFVISHTNRDG